MKPKLVECCRCHRLRPVWKRGRGGLPFCKSCAGVAETSVTRAKPARKALPRSSRPVKKISSKLINLHTIYKILRDRFMKAHPTCQAHLPGCSLVSTECHHMAGREGKLLLDDRYFKALCNHCHTWCTKHSTEAIALGLSISRLDVPQGDDHPLNQS